MGKNILKIYYFIISMIGVFTVNSTCAIGLGQEKEPEELNKYKKFKS